MIRRRINDRSSHRCAKLLRRAQPGLSLRRLIFQEHGFHEMKRCRLRLLNFLACLAALMGVNAVGAAENLRYLFLVDHSPAMATRRLATVDTIHYLVRSGFEKQIQPGEKFALWFYGSRLQT